MDLAELSATFTIAREMGTGLKDIATIIHVLPTLGERLQEVAFKALGHAIRI